MKRRRNSLFSLLLGSLILLLTGICFSGCHYSKPDLSDKNLSKKTKDSLNYLYKYHFTLNTNFEVRADTVVLERLPVKDQYLQIFKGDKVVVAEFMINHEDSIDSLWVKVARDQGTQGWIRESDLAKTFMPVDSISQFIYLFSDTHASYFVVIFAVFVIFYLFRGFRKKNLQLVYFNDIDSIYPLLLCLVMAFSATLYESMQVFVPETWQHYYFNPSLNPFKLPFVLTVFVLSIWGIILLTLAVIDDLFKQLSISSAFFYLLGLMSFCIFCYFFFMFTTSYYLGYIFFAMFLYLFICKFKERMVLKYRCGNCGRKIKEKGECPHCGAINK